MKNSITAITILALSVITFWAFARKDVVKDLKRSQAEIHVTTKALASLRAERNVLHKQLKTVSHSQLQTPEVKAIINRVEKIDLEIISRTNQLIQKVNEVVIL